MLILNQQDKAQSFMTNSPSGKRSSFQYEMDDNFFNLLFYFKVSHLASFQEHVE